MASTFTVQLKCDCSCRHVGAHGCLGSFPDRPAETTARELRAQAKEKGWEVLRHTKGRDVCPPCRIVEIRAASEIALPGGDA
jgi:hypothetical protein